MLSVSEGLLCHCFYSILFFFLILFIKPVGKFAALCHKLTLDIWSVEVLHLFSFCMRRRMASLAWISSLFHSGCLHSMIFSHPFPSPLSLWWNFFPQEFLNFQWDDGITVRIYRYNWEKTLPPVNASWDWCYKHSAVCYWSCRHGSQPLVRHGISGSAKVSCVSPLFHMLRLDFHHDHTKRGVLLEVMNLWRIGVLGKRDGFACVPSHHTPTQVPLKESQPLAAPNPSVPWPCLVFAPSELHK